MKKRILSLVIVLLMSTTFVPQKANAIAGAVLANSYLVIGGAVVSLYARIGNMTSTWRLILSISGLLLLNEEGRAQVELVALSDEDIEKMGITSLERDIYNSELEELNAIADEVEFSLNQLDKPTVDEAKDLWEENRELVSKESWSVLQKIAAYDNRK